jgi:hypothetical protein
MEPSSIELDPLVIEYNAPQPPDPGHHRLGWVVVLAALVATGVLAASVMRSGDREPPPLDVAPAATVLQVPSPTVASPPAQRPSRFSVVYTACMSDLGGSADSRERWVDTCRREAEEILHDERLYVVCMRNLGGTADALERRADECRNQTPSP